MVTDAVSIGNHHSNGIELTQYALTQLFGPVGGIILALAIFFFAFSTILTGYFYGECNIKYLFNNEKYAIYYKNYCTYRHYYGIRWIGFFHLVIS